LNASDGKTPREQRLAAKLRENLKRRKQQARSRNQVSGTQKNGQPATRPASKPKEE
jgi:hypothetical protein